MSVIPCVPELFAVLICPVSGAPLVVVGDELVSTDPATRRAYPVRDDVPVLLVDRSRVLSAADWRAALDRAGPTGGQDAPPD